MRRGTMTTVEEVNQAFKDRGVGVELPLPGEWLVKSVDILEKHRYAGGVRVLLGVRYIDDRGRENSDVFHCEGQISGQGKPVSARKPSIRQPLKSVLLPLRERMEFKNEDEAREYVREAIGHLLQDKGYSPSKHNEADLLFVKGEQKFFLNVVGRCDEKALEKTKKLTALRSTHGSMHDYGLVIPAFQESLGVSLRLQERWVSNKMDYVAFHRIGIYAVDNADPNRVYAFSIYPKSRELMSYFITTTSQWPMIKSRYVAGRERN